MKVSFLLNTVFVVEGKNDRERLAKLGIPYVVITDGSNVSRETLNHLQALEKKHKIVILTDPDGPGHKISAKLLASLTNPELLSVAKADAISKKGVGIEYVSLEILRKLLAEYMQKTYVSASDINYIDLINLNLSGPHSKAKRTHIAETFKLINGSLKTIYPQLLLLDIKLESIIELLNE